LYHSDEVIIMAKLKRRKCSKCERVGHNKTTCPNKRKVVRKKTTRKKARKKVTKKKAKKKTTRKKAKKKTTRKKAKKKVTRKKTTRKCSKCRRTGHTKPNCKNKKAKAPKRKPTTRRRTTRSTGSRALIGKGRGWNLYHYAGRTAKGNVSNKTWAVKRSGNKVWRHHGKTWGIKSSTPRTFATAAAAKKFVASERRKKLNKGYYRAGGNRHSRHR